MLGRVLLPRTVLPDRYSSVAMVTTEYGLPEYSASIFSIFSAYSEKDPPQLESFWPAALVPSDSGAYRKNVVKSAELRVRHAGGRKM